MVIEIPHPSGEFKAMSVCLARMELRTPSWKRNDTHGPPPIHTTHTHHTYTHMHVCTYIHIHTYCLDTFFPTFSGLNCRRIRRKVTWKKVNLSQIIFLKHTHTHTTPQILKNRNKFAQAVGE